MDIRKKITLLFTMMSVLMLCVGAGGFYFAFLMKQKVTSMTQYSIPSIQVLVKMQNQLWSAVQFGNTPEETSDRLQELETSLNDYSQTSVHPLKNDYKKKMLSRFLELQEDMASLTGDELAVRLNEMQQIFQDTVAKESTHLDSEHSEQEVLFRNLGVINLTLTGIGLMLALIPGWGLARMISRSLKEAQEVANQVSSGDLTVRLKSKRTDELGVLAKSFNRMLDTIHQADIEITREVDERIRAEQKAQEGAKAKSEFLAHMSHEFRTPLNGILGYTQMLLKDKGLTERNRQVVSSLQRSGQSLLELINDVLDLSKIDAQRLNIHQSRFYLKDFLDSIEESYSEQIVDKGLTFDVKLHTDLPDDIIGDQIRIRQVLVNLIGNAIKFTDEGGIIVDVKPLSMGVRFKVQDSGRGIRKEDFETIFQPFVQAEGGDKNHKGTGLGLSISRRLLEMMGTELRLDSKPGEGATFWFDLPQPDSGDRKLVVSPNKVVGYEGERKRIFLVEKKSEVGTSLTPLLRRVGFHVHTFHSGSEMQTEMKTLSPDAILSDLYIGEEDGVLLMKSVRKEFDNADKIAPPFILFSDHRKSTDRERSLSEGAADFMGKPLRFTDLLKVLETQLELVWKNEEEGSGDAKKPNTAEKIDAPIPSVEILMELEKLAQVGNVKNLRDRLNSVQADEPELRPFCEPLLTMCASYRLNSVLEQIQRLLADAKGASTS